jgi:hypothetical protein
MMTHWRSFLAANFLVLFALPATASAQTEQEASIADNLICATLELSECSPPGNCSRVEHAEVNAPALIRIDQEHKRLSGIQADGAIRVSTIRDSRRIGDSLLLQGNDLGEESSLSSAGWSLNIEAKSGQMIMAIAANGVGFVIFGKCEAR